MRISDYQRELQRLEDENEALKRHNAILKADIGYLEKSREALRIKLLNAVTIKKK